MVIRIFRATPKADKVKEYEQLLIEQIPEMKQTSGCLGARVLKSLGVVREVLFITVWDNLESVKAFAGIDWNTPVLMGNEVDLVEGDPEV